MVITWITVISRDISRTNHALCSCNGRCVCYSCNSSVPCIIAATISQLFLYNVATIPATISQQSRYNVATTLSPLGSIVSVKTYRPVVALHIINVIITQRHLLDIHGNKLIVTMVISKRLPWRSLTGYHDDQQLSPWKLKLRYHRY